MSPKGGANRGIAQLVEYRSPKPWVAGSNPPAPAKIIAPSDGRCLYFGCGGKHEKLPCVGTNGAERGSHGHFVGHARRAGISAVRRTRIRRERDLVIRSDRMGVGGYGRVAFLSVPKEKPAFF